MPNEIEMEQPLDLELLHRAVHLAYLVPTSIQRLTASGQATIPSSPLAASFEYTRMARHALLTPATKPKIEAPITSEYGAQPNQRSSQ